MTIKAVLFDIDGTLTERGRAIPGAASAIAHVRARGIEVRFLTNITGQTPQTIAANLLALGIEVEAAEIQTATTVCVELLAARPGLRCHLMVPASVMPMFDAIAQDDVNPDVVVVSDIGDGFTFAALNRAFRMLRDGADLMALQKNMFWFDAEGIRLDCGPFVLALEAASGKSATVTGKPSPVFFERALASLACERHEVLIVGDDLGTDIAGGNQVKVRTALVGTGKFADGQRTSTHWNADYYIDSIADLPQLIK